MHMNIQINNNHHNHNNTQTHNHNHNHNIHNDNPQNMCLTRPQIRSTNVCSQDKSKDIVFWGRGAESYIITMVTGAQSNSCCTGKHSCCEEHSSEIVVVAIVFCWGEGCFCWWGLSTHILGYPPRLCPCADLPLRRSNPGSDVISPRCVTSNVFCAGPNAAQQNSKDKSNEIAFWGEGVE